MGNGLRFGSFTATPGRQLMAMEHTDSASATPGNRSRPAQGLRLRPLPPCAEPSFPLSHEYFEVVYGPLIGPTCVLLARNLARHVESAGGPVTVCPIEISLEVGLRASHAEPVGKGSHLLKALGRLRHHRLVQPIGQDELGVLVAVLPLGGKAVARLPDFVRTRHAQFVERLGPS